MIDRVENEADMLHRHMEILRMVVENEPVGILKMSNLTEHPHHKVRYSLRVLEERNLIEPTNQGATTTEKTDDWIADLDKRIDETVTALHGMTSGVAVASSD